MTEIGQTLRSLRRRPMVPLLVVGILGLGLGGFIALWSAADAVLWRPLPFPDPERLVRVWGVGNGIERNSVNPQDAHDWGERSRSFAALAGFGSGMSALTGAGAPDYLPVPRVSASYFRVLGVRPALGRFFLDREQVLGEHRVAVLSWELWQSRFDGDPHVLGKVIKLDGYSYPIVGVAPPGLRSPAPEQLAQPALYRPLAVDPKNNRGGHYVTVIARLKPGLTIAAAQAELAAVDHQIDTEHPESTGWDTFIEPLHRSMAGEARPAITILMGASALLLLLACGNVTALLLARATVRQGELTVRGALGATRPRLVRQLLLEMAVLGAIAGALGVAVADALLRGLRAIGGGQVPLLDRAGLDRRALLAALAATLVTIVVAGLVPALEGVRNALAVRATASRERRRLERLLVAAQLSLCLILLVGAALLGRSLQHLYSVDPGFRPEGAYTFGVYLPVDRYPKDEMGPAFFARLEARLQAVPGVRAAGGVSRLPLSGSYSCSSVVVEGDQATETASEPCAEERIATPGYFAAIGLRPVAGRGFDARDSHRPLTIIVSRSFERHHWPHGSAIGHRVAWGEHVDDKTLWRTIVGVVPDVHHFGLDVPTKPEIYMPAAQEMTSDLDFVVRAANDQIDLGPSLRQAVAELDPQLPLARLRPMDELLADSTASRRLRTVTIGGFALLATILAAAGLYGSLAHAVASRRRELCIRMAVGAERRRILRLVIGEGATLAALGLLAGALGAVAAARALRQILFEVQPLDFPSFATAAGVLGAVALLAAWLPARRAAAVDPASALRQE